ncbi:MAG: hypothetical protein M3Q10_13805 [Chloroflexota bacterium]|nr:hypothetical protein [Chloroflexota bacterium]
MAEQVLSEETVTVRSEGAVLVPVETPAGVDLRVSAVPTFSQHKVRHVAGDGLVTMRVEPVASRLPTPPDGSDRTIRR